MEKILFYSKSTSISMPLIGKTSTKYTDLGRLQVRGVIVCVVQFTNTYMAHIYFLSSTSIVIVVV